MSGHNNYDPLIKAADKFFLNTLNHVSQSYIESKSKDKVPDNKVVAFTKAMEEKYSSQIPAEKVKKDKNAPKGKRNAYVFFSTAKRKELRENHPDMKFAEISQKCGELWSSMTPNEKAPFEKLAEEDAERLDKELEALKR